VGEKIAKFFTQKTLSEFVNISKKYKLDYVVVEKNFSSNLKGFSPKFENKKIKIYQVNDFKDIK